MAEPRINNSNFWTAPPVFKADMKQHVQRGQDVLCSLTNWWTFLLQQHHSHGRSSINSRSTMIPQHLWSFFFQLINRFIIIMIFITNGFFGCDQNLNDSVIFSLTAFLLFWVFCDSTSSKLPLNMLPPREKKTPPKNQGSFQFICTPVTCSDNVIPRCPNMLSQHAQLIRWEIRPTCRPSWS